MNPEETITLQIESSLWVCQKVDKLLKQYRRARTNRERSKILPQLESMRGRLMLESRFVDELIKQSDEEDDRGF